MQTCLATILKNELEFRRQKNPRYSLRAFARDLGLSSGRLSEVLNRTYVPGKRIMTRIAKALSIPESQIQEIQKNAVKTKPGRVDDNSPRVLSEEEFKLVSSIEHYSIFILLSIYPGGHDLGWFAKKLGVSEATVRQSLNRLKKLELVKLQDGKYFKVHKRITTTNELSSKTIRDSHKEVLNHAINSLDQVPLELRDITSITIPVDMNTLTEAKRQILLFRRKMAKLLEGTQRSEVYNLNIQLVPLTNVAKGAKVKS